MNDDDISRIASPRRPIAGEDPEVSRLTAAVVALLGEVTILRERIDTVERVAERADAFARAEIEGYEPDAAADGERAALRRRTIERVLRPFREGAEQAADRAGALALAAEADRILDQETGA